MTKVKQKKGLQWDVVIFYILLLIMSVYLGNSLKNDITSMFNNDCIKTEYKIELVNQDSVKVYSVSNDTVYECEFEEIQDIIHTDNL